MRNRLNLINFLYPIKSYFQSLTPSIRKNSASSAGEFKTATLSLANNGQFKSASLKSPAMHHYRPQSTSPDNNLSFELPILRARSRDIIRNNPIAEGIISTFETGVIGSGLELISTIDNEVLGLDESEAKKLNNDIETAFKNWAESEFADTERTSNFYELQLIAFRQMLENGETLALITSRNSYQDVDMAINLIEADLLETPPQLKSQSNIFFGIRKDEFGAPVSYFFKQPKRLADSYIDAYDLITDNYKEILTYDEYNLRRVLHLYKKTRPGQTRGVPLLTNEIATLKQLDRYTDAEIIAAVIAASFTAFISDSAGVTPLAPNSPFANDGGQEAREQIAMEPGAIVELSGNRKIDIANPTRPNAQFGEFVMSILRQVSMGVNLPYEVVIKHFQSSYSASQGALEEAQKVYDTYRKRFIGNFVKPIYERFFIDAIKSGFIQAPGFFDSSSKRRAYLSAEWIGPAKRTLDELKAVKAAELRVNIGVSTLQKEASRFGSNIDRVLEQRAREIKKMKELGIPINNVSLEDKQDSEGDNA